MKIIILTLLFGLMGYTISKPTDSKAATEALVEHRSSDIELPGDEETLSFYGGLKGQYVHIKDGKVVEITDNGKSAKSTGRQGPLAAASQLAVTAPQQRLDVSGHKAGFEQDFHKIQQAAARLVAIQELAKRRGNFSPEDNRVYAASLLELGQAAQNLARLQQTGEIQDFSVLLKPIEEAALMPQKTPQNSDKLGENELEKVETVVEQHFNESELLPPNQEDPYEDANDSVAITPPKKDASVAEAKPVGISIAGIGGVASAKPNAVALSGRNGLAVSAPKATALAGVTAEEAAAFSVSLPGRHNLIIKNSSSRFAAPSYDYYDEIDTSPLRASGYNAALLRTANSEESKYKPMQATLNAADAIVKMWRTAMAQDRAAADNDSSERTHNENIEKYFKDFKRMNQFHRY